MDSESFFCSLIRSFNIYRVNKSLAHFHKTYGLLSIDACIRFPCAGHSFFQFTYTLTLLCDHLSLCRCYCCCSRRCDCILLAFLFTSSFYNAFAFFSFSLSLIYCLNCFRYIVHWKRLHTHTTCFIFSLLSIIALLAVYSLFRMQFLVMMVRFFFVVVYSSCKAFKKKCSKIQY